MNHRFRVPLVFLMLSLVVFFCSLPVFAAKPIAKISSFRGEVTILSGTEFAKVTQVGKVLNQGDTVQTKEGEAEISFDDGAVLKVRRHTTTMLHEQEEKSGWWVFKTKEWARRLTCHVGTFWFKSGPSKTKNYFQTPTAVCGIRGSIAEFGYDNVMSYVNAIEGSVEAKGQIQQVASAFFQNLQAQAQQFASQNQVHTQLSNAFNKDQKAKQTGAALDQADAKAATLAATATAIAEILKNPELGEEARQILQKALENVQNDLTKAQEDFDKLNQETPTTTAPVETTTVAEPTTTVPPTTVSISIPTTTTTTTTTSSTTTTTTSAVSPPTTSGF